MHSPSSEAATQPAARSAVVDRINAERFMLLAWSRAILLQMAHPLVAAGVDAHSSIRGGPFAAFHRLHGTVRAMRAIAFGDTATRARAIAGIRAIHDRVYGRLDKAVGPWPVGTTYSAHDPSLLLWVHCTLIESVLLFYEQVVGPLTEADKDAYCLESVIAAVEVGAQEEDVPRRWSDLRRYMQGELDSGRIAVGDSGRAVASRVLSPPMGWLTGPIGPITRIVTIGSLPESVRMQYGYAWTDRDARRFVRALRLVKATRAILPRSLAWWPEARRL